MAFQKLVEGGCGESNSLVGLTHHFTKDKAYTDEGLKWQSRQHLLHNRDTASNAVPVDPTFSGAHKPSELLVEEFMRETQQAAMKPFRMDSLMQEMREIESSLGPPMLGPAVADLAQSSDKWVEEFLATEAQALGMNSTTEDKNSSVKLTGPDDVVPSTEHFNSRNSPQLPHHVPMGHNPANAHPRNAMPGYMHRLPTDLSMIQPGHMRPGHQFPHMRPGVQFPPMHSMGPGLQFPPTHGFMGPAPQFSPMHMSGQYFIPHQFPPPASMPLNTRHQSKHSEEKSLEVPAQEDSELAKTANELLGTVDDPQLANTEFMQFVHKLGENAVDVKNNSKKKSAPLPTTLADSFSVSTAPPIPSTKEELENFEVDSSKIDPEYRKTFFDELQKKWSEVTQDHDGIDEHSWLSEEIGLPDVFKPYQFCPDNALASHPDPLTEGERCLAAGDLPSAVLLFEAAVQKDQENAKAWYLLGTTHAENEQDTLAIPALKKCVELDPNYSDAWMALATSFTNENFQTLACYALKDWLRSKSKYSHLVGEGESNIFQNKVHAVTMAPRSLVDEIEALYLKAANLEATPDPDVQCGLGVFFNLSGEYAKAVDCFECALNIKPDDARLWNKLGATLANSSQSHEAVLAYQKALELSPGFIRCRYNLAVACLNLSCHKEAVEHLVSALSLQAAGRGLSVANSKAAVSDNIWATLRLCLPGTDKSHLMAAVDKRDIQPLIKEFGSGAN